MAYATLADLNQYLGIDTSTDDALLAACLARAQKFIENDRLRTFEYATTTRYYPASAVDGQDLLLDADLLTVTTLTNGDGTVLGSSTYILLPRNGSPKYAIRLKSDYTWNFNDGDSEVTVLGTWGYATVAPADIIEACLELAAYFYRLKDSQVFDITASPELGVITIPKGIPATVRKILDGYPKRAGMGAV